MPKRISVLTIFFFSDKILDPFRYIVRPFFSFSFFFHPNFFPVSCNFQDVISMLSSFPFMLVYDLPFQECFNSNPSHMNFVKSKNFNHWSSFHDKKMLNFMKELAFFEVPSCWYGRDPSILQERGI